jgi:hypothetical protein
MVRAQIGKASVHRVGQYNALSINPLNETIDHLALLVIALAEETILCDPIQRADHGIPYGHEHREAIAIKNVKALAYLVFEKHGQAQSLDGVSTFVIELNALQNPFTFRSLGIRLKRTAQHRDQGSDF